MAIPIQYRAVLAAVAVFAVACENGGPRTNDPETTELLLSEVGGNGQRGKAGQALSSPLRVRVTDDRHPVAGVEVSWRTSSGRISAAGPTDSDGVAEATWTLGSLAGGQSAEASLTDTAISPLTFLAEAEAGPAARLAPLSQGVLNGGLGTGGSLAVGVHDRFGNPVSGAEVVWAVDSGGATVEPESTLTDEDGAAGTEVTLSSILGSSVITARSAGLAGSPVRFLATAYLYVFVGDNFFGPAELTVAAGTTVTWLWADAFNAHNVVPDLSEPARSGDPVSALQHQYSHTFTIPGTYRYSCQVHGLPGGSGMSGVIHVTP
jgi:plastocyanin